MIFLSTSCREHRSASLPLAQSRLNLLPWDTRSLRGACWEARTLLGHVYARFFQWPQKSTPLVRLLSKPEADVMFQVNASLSLSQIWFLHMYNLLVHAWQTYRHRCGFAGGHCDASSSQGPSLAPLRCCGRATHVFLHERLRTLDIILVMRWISLSLSMYIGIYIYSCDR